MRVAPAASPLPPLPPGTRQQGEGVQACPTCQGSVIPGRTPAGEPVLCSPMGQQHECAIWRWLVEKIQEEPHE